MKNKRVILAAVLLLTSAAARRSSGAILLSSMQNPTLQTLIDLGNTGVTVGTEQFDNFNFVAGSGAGPTSASQILVQPATSDGNGLEFVATWFAADGGTVSDVITYEIKATLPSENPGWIDLFSNGTAPAPGSGTFTTATLTAQTSGGVPAAPTLSTYNDGQTTPVDTTKPDINFATTTVTPQPALEITDSIFAASAAPSSGNSGGLATISVIQNTFGSVPEPATMGWIFPPMALLLTSRGRKNKPRMYIRGSGPSSAAVRA